MADLVVVVPSRGRPEAATALAQHFKNTCTADTRLVFAVDDDDPSVYGPLIAGDKVRVYAGDNSTMVEALNSAATGRAVELDSPFAIGFMGDDHCPRTVGWDSAYIEALRELGTGIVYGNDLLQGSRLPTQCAMTSDIVRALGYMCPPVLRHLFVDNYWRDLGKAAECLRYLPDVTVEHRHPLAGKAQWDEGYQRVNAPEVATHDELAYQAFMADGLAADVAKVRALRGAS